MRRKALRGIGRVRRIMRRLPEAMQAQIVDVLTLGGQALVGQMRARAPRLTGALQAGISFRVLPKTMRLRAGLLKQRRSSKYARQGFVESQDGPFYGRIQDLGRKAQTVTVTRHIKQRVLKGNNRNGNVRRTVFSGKPYQMRVKAMAPKRFVTGRFPEARGLLKRMLAGAWSKAIASIAGGKGD